MFHREAEHMLILGGAGFIGSHLTAAFAKAGHQVTVIDGLLPRTGADRRHLELLPGRIRFIEQPIEDVSNLGELIGKSDTVIDCMGWTCHLLAVQDPGYDAQLNLASHRVLLQSVRAGRNPAFIYLGTRSQYGRPKVDRIVESCALEPVDIQGIHKAAAEYYYRFFAASHNLAVVSLRVPNCVGPNQLIEGPDIGLFGGLARDLLEGKTVTVYGSGRHRALIDVRDLVGIVRQIAAAPHTGFEAYNVPGRRVALDAGARLLRDQAGSGEVRQALLPDEIAQIDMGEAEADCSKLHSLIGEFPLTSLEETFRTMVDYFREELP